MAQPPPRVFLAVFLFVRWTVNCESQVSSAVQVGAETALSHVSVIKTMCGLCKETQWCKSQTFSLIERAFSRIQLRESIFFALGLSASPYKVF